MMMSVLVHLKILLNEIIRDVFSFELVQVKTPRAHQWRSKLLKVRNVPSLVQVKIRTDTLGFVVKTYDEKECDTLGKGGRNKTSLQSRRSAFFDHLFRSPERWSK